MLRPYKDKFKPMLAHKGLAVGGARKGGAFGAQHAGPLQRQIQTDADACGASDLRGVEGDVDYGFEVYRGALFGGGRNFHWLRLA